MTRSNPSKSAVLEMLTTRHIDRELRVFFDGVDIGRIVSYGKAVGFARARIKTAYGSRIHSKIDGCSVSIEEEAGSHRALLDKVAASLARKLKAHVPDASISTSEGGHQGRSDIGAAPSGEDKDFPPKP